MHKVEVKDNKWHLASSPVNDEQYDDAWVTANGVASGVVNNRGISTYDNGAPDTDSDAGGPDTATGHWRYFQSGVTVTTFADGVGYSLKSGSASGDIYEFTGTFQQGTISPDISQATTNYNLVGNPYNAYVDIAAFITENSAKLTGPGQTIYVWNATSSSYTGLTTGFLQPGQGFFVDSSVASSTVDFTLAMQGHDAAATFYKSASTSLKLNLKEGANIKTTSINYLDGKTTILDPRFDIGMFNGVASDLRVYTHLLENNEGIALEKQALPNTGLEDMVIPVGVKALVGKEITFSVNASNLPTELKVFLEDREKGTFTRLDELNSEYKITLEDALDGVGRFFLHTKPSTVLSTGSEILNSVSIYKTNNNNLRISGLSSGKAEVSLFNLLGVKVMQTSFEGTSKNIVLPNLASGVYLVNLQTEGGKISKKIILE